VRFAERLRNVPATIFLCDDVLLKALMCGSSITDELAAGSLQGAACKQTRAGDGNERITRGHDSVGPAVEAKSGPRVQFRRKTFGIEAGPVQKIVRRMKDGKTAHEGAGQTFTLKSCPGPCGVDLLKMIATVQLMRQFEVMEDSKDGLGNFHEKGNFLWQC